MSSGDEDHRLGIEIQAGHGHDRIVEEVLIGNKELRHSIKQKVTFVMLRVKAFEKVVADSKDGQMLDVGVAVGVICDDMVYIVRVPPPRAADADEA